jgi:hypothetical protein
MIRTRLLSSAAIVLLATITAASAQTNTTTERDRDRAPPAAAQDRSPASDTQKRDGAQDQRNPSSAQSSQDQRNRNNAQGTPPAGSGSSSTAASPSTPSGSTPSTSAQSPSKSDGTSPSTADQRKATDSKSSQSTTPSQPNSAQSSQSSPPASATQTAPNAGARSQDNARSNTNAQPSTSAQTPSTNTQAQSAPAQAGANVQLSEQQSTRISAAISSANVRPVTNVNFAISVGTVVPRSVRIQTLPTTIVSVVPQYRGYSYFVTNEQIVIVEPRTYKIVTVLPYSGRGGQTATVRERSKVSFSPSQRQAIRKQVTTSGRASNVSRTIEIGEAVPDEVELTEFPRTIYREVPTVREYRYYRTDRNVVVVDPSDRRVIEIIE